MKGLILALLEKTKVVVAHRTDASVFNHAVVDITHLSPVDRWLRAAAALGACWVAAAVFILVPVLHFFLVPSAFLAGIGAFIYKVRLKELMSAALLKCPQCQKELPLKKAAFNWPRRETCNQCRTSLTIGKA